MTRRGEQERASSLVAEARARAPRPRRVGTELVLSSELFAKVQIVAAPTINCAR